MLVCAGAAQAQTSVKLVGNTGQTLSSFETFGSFDYSQLFTTGSISAGYQLTSVDIDFQVLASFNSTDPTYTVSIWKSGGTSAVGTLTKPGTLTAGNNRFHASGGGIHLDASTTYFVLIDVSSARNRLVALTDTSSTRRRRLDS